MVSLLTWLFFSVLTASLQVLIFDARPWLSGKYKNFLADRFEMDSLDNLCWQINEDPPAGSLVGVIYATTHYGEPPCLAFNILALIVFATPKNITYPSGGEKTLDFPFPPFNSSPNREVVSDAEDYDY